MSLEAVMQAHDVTANFIAAMGAAATGVSVVTTEGPAGKFGLTVSAISSVSADPPLLLACVNRKSPAFAAIMQNGRFAVNLLGSNNQDVAEIFAGRPKSGTPYDFTRHDWGEGETGQLLLGDATATIECEIESSQDAGSHCVCIGRVIAAKRNSAEPLVYCNRAFGRVAQL
jgi:flavin reductase (DIM6/NTAB) family NADH-FMN oxidoreductase RutF